MPYEGDTKQLLWKGQKLWPIYYKIPWDLCQKEEQGVSGCVLSHADRAGGSGTSVVTSQLRASGTAAAPKGQGWETPACPKEPVKTISTPNGCNSSSCTPSNRLSRAPETLLHALHGTQRPEEPSLSFHGEGGLRF